MKRLDYIPKLSKSCVALGFFDGIHLGHAAVAAAAFDGEGTRVVLSVGSKGTLPLLTEQETLRQTERIGADMLAAPAFAEIKDMSGEEFVRDVLRDSLGAVRVACGENYRFGAGAACGAQDLAALCEKYGIDCRVVPLVLRDGEVISSSAVRAALAEGDVTRAAALLGRYYGYTLPVVSGQQLARRFGTPTINQPLPEGILLPRFGVYASLSAVDGRRYQSVTNIGVRPTVGGETPVSETWLQDFSGDLYDREIRVELVGFIRPEQRFDSLEALRSQIISDGIKAGQITGKICQKAD